jgi:hypothetical protein
MSLKDEIIQHRSRLTMLETDLVGSDLRADKLRNDLQSQISFLRKVRDLSPEAIGEIALRLVGELTAIQEKVAEAAAIRQALGK